MPNNLIISYDLYRPVQKYEEVAEAIKSLGNWAKIHDSVWYVNSRFDAQNAVNKIWAVMDANDTVLVVDVTNGNAAWENVSDEVANYMISQWNS